MGNTVSATESSKRPKLTEAATWHWKKFSPSGSVRTFAHYAKLVYGILGLCFFIYAALMVSPVESQLDAKNLPPSSWYWMWLVSDTAEDAAESEDDDDLGFSETIDSAAVQRDQTLAPWGTTGAGRSVQEWIGIGAGSYILYGIVASIIGMLGGLGFALMTEWFTRPAIPLPHKPSAMRRVIRGIGRTSLEVVDSIPKFLLVLAIFAAGHLSVAKFSIGMGVFLMFGTAALFRERTASFLASEQYLYALEIGLHPARILFVHLVKRQLVPLLLVQLPFMLSTFIMWEATMSFIDFQVLNNSWGHLIKNSYDTGGYLFWIPMLSLLFVVSSLYLLGDAVKERVEPVV